MTRAAFNDGLTDNGLRKKSNRFTVPLLRPQGYLQTPPATRGKFLGQAVVLQQLHLQPGMIKLQRQGKTLRNLVIYKSNRKIDLERLARGDRRERLKLGHLRMRSYDESGFKGRALMARVE
jgi:hypothetical protein